MCLLGCEFIIVAFRSAKECVLRRKVYGNPTRERGIAAGSSLTRRVTIAWHERPDRESMGETPMPLSNTQFHRPLKQRAGERGIAVGSSEMICLIASLTFRKTPWFSSTQSLFHSSLHFLSSLPSIAAPFSVPPRTLIPLDSKRLRSPLAWSSRCRWPTHPTDGFF